MNKPRHPDEDAEVLTPEEEEKLHKLSKEYINALEFDDQERARELRAVIKDLAGLAIDKDGWWI
jgi:hypothetical protein